MAVAIQRFWDETRSHFHAWGFWAVSGMGRSAVQHRQVEEPHPDMVGDYHADYSFLSEADLEGVDAESNALMSRSKLLSESHEL
jgi:hypothetical protein